MAEGGHWLCSLRNVRFSQHKFTRRGGLETFFHKIVMIRNNLRVLAPGSIRASRVALGALAGRLVIWVARASPRAGDCVTRSRTSLRSFTTEITESTEPFELSTISNQQSAIFVSPAVTDRSPRSTSCSKTRTTSSEAEPRAALASTTCAAIIENGRITKPEGKKKWLCQK
jgi:hypothetical protein